MGKEELPKTDEQIVNESIIKSLVAKSMAAGAGIGAAVMGEIDVVHTHNMTETDGVAIYGGIAVALVLAIFGAGRDWDKLEKRLASRKNSEEAPKQK